MTKQGIREQVKALMNRNDFTDALANMFIDQAVARIQRTLRVPAMEKAVVYTVGSSNGDSLVIPTDFLQLKHLYIANGLDKYTLQYKDLESFLRYPDSIGTKPLFYTKIQGDFKLKPTPASGTQIAMIYYGEIADLVADSDTNMLTAIAPDLLVYGALTYTADYFVDERKAAFEETFARIYSELVEQASIDEMSQQGIAITPAYNMEY